jgi:hypothetical protein
MTQTDAHVDPVRLAELHKEYGEYPGHLELSWVRGTATLGEFLGLIDRAMQAATAGGAVKVKDWLQVAKLAGEHGVRYRTNRALERFLSDIRAALEPATATAQEGAGPSPLEDARILAVENWLGGIWSGGAEVRTKPTVSTGGLGLPSWWKPSPLLGKALESHRKIKGDYELEDGDRRGVGHALLKAKFGIIEAIFHDHDEDAEVYQNAPLVEIMVDLIDRLTNPALAARVHPTPAPEPGSVEGLVERLRDFDAARAAFVRAVAEYNERLLYEKKIGEWPPRIGDLYERMEDAKRDWFKVAEKLADDTKGTEAASALTTLQQHLAASETKGAEAFRLAVHHQNRAGQAEARATAAEAERDALREALTAAAAAHPNDKVLAAALRSAKGGRDGE